MQQGVSGLRVRATKHWQAFDGEIEYLILPGMLGTVRGGRGASVTVAWDYVIASDGIGQGWVEDGVPLSRVEWTGDVVTAGEH